MTNQPLLDHAVTTMQTGSKSFATASKLFDPHTRRSVLMLYTWCRHCDDVIDDQTLGFRNQTFSPQSAELRLSRLEALTRQAFAGHSMRDPAFAAFQEVVMTHGISRQYAFEHLQGFAMDVYETHYRTIDDTLRYCYHVAGVVGLMMAQIMGVQDASVLDRACDLGLAFQLTNIARDIVEDAHAGRCYLPEAWLQDAGLNREDFAAPHNRDKLAQVASRLVNEAEPYYVSALQGVPALPLRSACAIATAKGVYREIGVKVTQAGAHAWDQRQSTSKKEKLGLLLSGAAVAFRTRAFSKPMPRPATLWHRPHPA